MRLSKFEYDTLVARQRAKRPIPEVDSGGVKADVEDDLRDNCCNYLNGAGLLWFSSRTDKRTGRRPGEPDIQIVFPRGRSLWVELKDKDGKLSTDQRDILAWLRREGHATAVVRSYEDFVAIVERFARTGTTEHPTGFGAGK